MLRPLAAVSIATSALCACQTTVRMPGQAHQGPLPASTADELRLAGALRNDVRALAADIGERNSAHPAKLERARAYVAHRLEAAVRPVDRHRFTADGASFENLTVIVPSAVSAATDDRVLLVGAHYDSAPGTPGANDNGTGVAALLALADRFARVPAQRTIWFVAFTNEEPPYFGEAGMGSRKYVVERGASLTKVGAMISLETMGYYSEAEGSQQYPWPLGWFYPSRGNFVGIAGNHESRELIRQLVGDFRSTTPFPMEGAALSRSREPIGWSDHSPFWDLRIPAVMVTDTAPFRYPHYHRPSDTVDKVDFDRLARVVLGLERALRLLAGRATLPPWSD